MRPHLLPVATLLASLLLPATPVGARSLFEVQPDADVACRWFVGGGLLTPLTMGDGVHDNGWSAAAGVEFPLTGYLAAVISADLGGVTENPIGNPDGTQTEGPGAFAGRLAVGPRLNTGIHEVRYYLQGDVGIGWSWVRSTVAGTSGGSSPPALDNRQERRLALSFLAGIRYEPRDAFAGGFFEIDEARHLGGPTILYSSIRIGITIVRRP